MVQQFIETYYYGLKGNTLSQQFVADMAVSFICRVCVGGVCMTISHSKNDPCSHEEGHDTFVCA